MTHRQTPDKLQITYTQIASKLCGYQPQVDSLFDQAIQRKGKITNPESVRLITCWLVTLTHLLTGSRLQLERWVQTPRSRIGDDSRSILVYRDNGQLGRIIMRDKQAQAGNIKVNYPTLTVFPPNLSSYWLLYLMFVTEVGARLAIQFDYKINDFLAQNNIIVDRAYELRHLYLNNLGLQCDFDIQIMTQAGYLVRHDIRTQHNFYTVWRRLFYSLDTKPRATTMKLAPPSIDMDPLQSTINDAFAEFTPATVKSLPLMTHIEPIKSTFADKAHETKKTKAILTQNIRRSSENHRIIGIDTSQNCTAVCFWKSEYDFHVLYRTRDGSSIADTRSEHRWKNCSSVDGPYLKDLVHEIRKFDAKYVIVEAPLVKGRGGGTLNNAQHKETNTMIKLLQRYFDVSVLKHGCAKAAYLSSPVTTNIISKYPPLIRKFQTETGGLAGVDPDIGRGGINKPHPSHDILDAYLLCFLQAELAAYAHDVIQ